MKKGVRSYISFTRKERIGLFTLAAILLLLIIVRIGLPYLVHPAVDEAENDRLSAAWQKYLRSQPKKTAPLATIDTQEQYTDSYDNSETPLPDKIDLNTADSATLVRLKGIGPATAAKIIAHRTRKGPFTSIDQLMEVRSLPKETFDMLKRHLVVSPHDSSTK